MNIKQFLAFLLMKFFQLFPVNRNKIFFSSYQGTAYNSYPRMISESLASLNRQYKIVWALKPNVEAPSYIKRVKPETISELFALATSGVWIDNCRKHLWVRKKRCQLYIQTWHGAVCIKAVESDASLNNHYVRMAKNDSRMANYILSQCEWRTNNILKAFWYDGELVKGGTEIYNQSQIKNARDEVREFYGLPKDTKILLYAPTFRKNNKKDAYNINFKSIISKIKDKFGGNWVILFRLHPNLANEKIDIDGVVNGNLFQNMEPLIAACDILITDYSGCIFNAFKLNKVVFLYASDYENYVLNERKLYFDFNSFPASLSKTNEELEFNISSFSFVDYYEKVKLFNKFLGYYEDDGIEKIVLLINEYQNGGIQR